MLIHSKFDDEPSPNDALGCKSCYKCFLCKNYLIETTKFKSFECGDYFSIKQAITCEDEGIIYLILDNLCNRTYTGSTIDCMKTRMANYKNHLKTSFKGCEMAQHFAECSDIHSLYRDDTVSNRTRDFQNKFDQNLSEQIKVILIEKVDLSSCETTKQKRDLIECHEGYWQTQLRTLSRYGGLNKKDDRKITNNRNATRKVTVSTTEQPVLDLDGTESTSNTDQERQENAPAPPTMETPEDSSYQLRRSSRLRNKSNNVN